MTIDTLYNELEAARVAWNGINDLLVKGKYDFGRARPLLSQQSMDVFRRRVNLVFETLFALRPKEANDIAAVVVGGRLTDLLGHVQNFKTYAESTVSQLRANWREGATVQDGNENFVWQLFEESSNYVSVDMTANVQQMHSSMSFLVGAIGAMLPIQKADAVADLSARVEALGNAVRDAETMRKQVQHSAKTAETSATRAGENEKGARTLLTKIEAVVAQVQEFQQQANTGSSGVTALLEKTKTIATGAEKLEALVATYQSKFEAFQKGLDERNGEFVQFQTDAKAAKEANEEREQEIDRLTKNADGMISGATTAGLGKSLEDTRERYENRMNGARTGFKWSVAFLVVSALPLAAHLLPGMFGEWFPKVSDAAHASWYGVLGKILLMIPATWLTGFYTKSYADFFHLEREYAHKAALAGSIDGFKRQAPKYEEEITAEVFMEIRNNPAKGQVSEPVAHPLYDVLSKVVSKTLDKKKEETGK